MIDKLVLLFALFAPNAVAVQRPAIAITLRPERDTAGAVAAVNVTYVISDVITHSSIREFRAPIVANNLIGIADRIENLRIVDRSGVVRLIVSDDPPDATASGYYRHWKLARPLDLPATVRYCAAVAARRFRAGPPMDLRAYANGVSGRGAGFLAMPNDGRRYRIRFRWDLSELAPGSVGVSSLADGDADTAGPLSLVSAAFFMAGPLGSFAEGSAYKAYWLGESPSLNLREDMPWAAQAYTALSRFFGDTTARPYRFFLRVLPESTTSGGNAANRSFMIQVPLVPISRPGGEGLDLRGIIAHEMIHGWAGGPEGGRWSTEGLTSYFTADALLRTGLRPVEDFVRDVNRMSREYYPNPFRNSSDTAAAVAFWADKNAEVLPYHRGALYFFDINDKLKKASGGKRTVDAVMFAFNARRARGEAVNVETWRKTLRKELGASAVADFDSIIVQGTKTIVLAPDAFGPCFQRRTEQLVRPDFGFDRRTPDVRRIVSLVPGSAAAAADLRDGDVVTTTLGNDVLMSKDARQLQLDIVRSGQPLRIEYMTRPALVDVYLWSRVPGVAEDICRS